MITSNILLNIFKNDKSENLYFEDIKINEISKIKISNIDFINFIDKFNDHNIPLNNNSYYPYITSYR